MNDIDLLTINEFAEKLRIRPSCARRWIRERKIAFVHVGRLVRIPATEVARLIQAGTQYPRGGAHQ